MKMSKLVHSGWTVNKERNMKGEGGGEDTNISTVSSLELDRTNSTEHIHSHNDEYEVTSAHIIGNGFNCGYILSFSNLILVPLGWTWGIICMLTVGIYSWYANYLLASFHFINRKRFIRYRDIMGFLYGRELYYITSIMQYSTFILGNMGFILLGGRALKEINSELSGSNPLRLQYFVVMTGTAYFLFASMIPTMSAMKYWLVVSTTLTLSYIVVVVVALIENGKSNRNRKYDIRGSTAGKVFNALGAISALVFCNNSGLLLEIQSTVRQPAVKNMRKTLNMQYTVGLSSYYGIIILGYWAFGSTAPEYLPEGLSGLTWVKILINSTVFLQSVVSQHMFVLPIHETLDTKFLKLDERMFSGTNIRRRFCLRAMFFTGNTLVAAAFPFMGDFVNLVGSFTLIPLTFVFPSMIFLKIKAKTDGLEKMAWHWFNIIIFSALTAATTVSAVWLIVDNIRKYSFFADI